MRVLNHLLLIAIAVVLSSVASSDGSARRLFEFIPGGMPDPAKSDPQKHAQDVEAKRRELVGRLERDRQRHIDDLVKGGATKAEAEAAIDERLQQARSVPLESLADADISPKLDSLSVKLYIMKSISPLGHDRTRSLMKFLGIDAQVPTGVYQCLCTRGAIMGSNVGYHPAHWGDCNNDLPCKGGNWGCVSFELPSDPALWASCLGSQKVSADTSVANALVDKAVSAKTSPPGAAPPKKYKDICLKAYEMFPIEAWKYRDGNTHILWDEDMLKSSMLDGLKRYSETPSVRAPRTSADPKTGETYGLWLFGHGQSQLGGPMVDKWVAQDFVDVQTAQNDYDEHEKQLANLKREFAKKYEWDTPGQKAMETYLKSVKRHNDALAKAKIKLYRLEARVNLVKKGTEPYFLEGLKELKTSLGRQLTPSDVMKLALEHRDGEVDRALLLAHNTLRALARPGQGDFGVTGVDGDPKLFDDLFVKLREGDNSGVWYHTFGTAFFRYKLMADVTAKEHPSTMSDTANTLEQFFREWWTKQPPDPEKYCFNVWGANAGAELYQKVHPVRSIFR